MRIVSAVMSRFAVIRVRGPSWDLERPMRAQDGWADHAAFMHSLVADGFVILGGPLEDGQRVLLIVEAATEAEVRTRLADDPWSPTLRPIASVDEWEILFSSDAGG